MPERMRQTPSSTLADRLSTAMQSAGKTNQSELAREIGVKPQAIQYLLAPSNGATGSKHIAALAAALGVSSTWLASGDGMQNTGKEPAPNVEPGPDIKGKGRYPLISWVQAGEWTELCDNFQPGDADEWPVSHHNLGECGYFLRVKGQSMTAPPGSRLSFPEGMLLHVRPESDALPGQFVIVRRTAEKEATFKRLSLVDGELFLEAINPDWPKRYLPLKEGDVICGLVVDASLGNLP